MIVTETEAAKLACPFARLFDGAWQNEPNPTCLGSGCMSWDWVDGETISANHMQHGCPLPAKLDRVEGESLADYDKRYGQLCVEHMNEQGWTKISEAATPLSVLSWRRAHPAQRGQCQRTLSLAEDR